MQNQFFSWTEGITSLPDRGLESIIHTMDYPFLFYEAFSSVIAQEQMVKYFQERLLLLIFDYMEGWVQLAMADGKNMEDIHRHFFQFSQSLDAKKVYETIVGGNEFYDIHVPLNNSSFRIKRFGDCLGVKLISENSRKEVHEKGTAAMQQIAKEERSFVSQFWHRVEFIFSVSKCRREDSVLIDLEGVYQRLTKACPFVDWIPMSEFFSKVDGAYKHYAPASIGKLQCIDIQVQFVHHSGRDSRQEIQWRRGNILKREASSIFFSYGDDLCLSITAHSGLPKSNFTCAVDPELDISELQFKLKNAASTIYFQLLAQALNVR